MTISLLWLDNSFINADMCGSKAEWPPYLKDDDGYAKLTLARVKRFQKHIATPMTPISNL